VKQPSEEEVFSDNPGEAMTILEAYDIEGEVAEEELPTSAREFGERNPVLIHLAKRTGKDIVALWRENKRAVVLVGGGLAAVFALTGYVILRSRMSKGGGDAEGESSMDA
jgi:hypothetical protein